MLLSTPALATAETVAEVSPVEVSAEQPTPAPSEEPTPAPSEQPTPAPSEQPTAVPSEEPTPTPSEEPGVSTLTLSDEPAAPAPRAANTLTLNFWNKETQTNLGADEAYVEVSAFTQGGGYNDCVIEYQYDKSIEEDGSVSLPLEQGKIYQLTAYPSPDYMPDMGTTFKTYYGTEFWVYTSADGLKPVTDDTLDALMEDAVFADQINRHLEDNYDLETTLFKYANTFDIEIAYNDPAYRPRLLKQYLATFPKLAFEQGADGTCSATLTYIGRKAQPLKIVAVGEDGNPLPVAASFCSSESYWYFEPALTCDGVILDAPDLPTDLYLVTVDGCHESMDKSYIRKNAETEPCGVPANFYFLAIYAGTDGIELVTPANYDELSKDPQFQAAAREWNYHLGMTLIAKDAVMSYEGVSIENGVIKVPFKEWTRQTAVFKAVDRDTGSEIGAEYDGYEGATGTMAGQGALNLQFIKPGLYTVTADSTSHKYMPTAEPFRYDGENEDQRGRYNMKVWVPVTAGAAAEVVNDAKLAELCADGTFLDYLFPIRGNDYHGYLENLASMRYEGVQIPNDCEALKRELRIQSYTLEKNADGALLLPFDKLQPALELTGTKDKVIFGRDQSGVGTTSITYTCPQDGTYYIGLGVSESCAYNSLTVTGAGFTSVTINPNAIIASDMGTTVELKAGVTYTLTVNMQQNSAPAYYCVYLERKPTVGADVDLHTADYIKFNAARYSNMTSLSCGETVEHRILARYPGDRVDLGAWAFNVAMPTGVDYADGSLTLQYLPGSAGQYAGVDYWELKDLPLDGFVPLETEVAFTPAASFDDKNLYTLTLPENGTTRAGQAPQPGDLVMVTYTGTVNTAAWYGSVHDTNRSFGYWSILDDGGAVVEVYNKFYGRAGDWQPGEAFVRPAICQVFGIKVYKYSNYDRMMTTSKDKFDEAVLTQEHLLGGAEFRIEGDNLSNIIVIRDDKVALEDQPEQPAMLSAVGGAEATSNTAGGGAALARRIDDETVMKLLYYRYEQGLQALSDISVAQTQTYYALNEDNLYTRTAPTPETVQFYADNGQGYRLKPSMFSAEAGDTVRVGDGGGLLLGGLGAGEYTLTETKAPDGYALIDPIHINIRWVKEGANGFEPIGADEVPVWDYGESSRSAYCMICEMDDTPVNSLMDMGHPWDPNMGTISGSGGYESIWNPVCFVLVNPIGDDRISFASGKEANDPADRNEAFTLKFQINNPDGTPCTKVKYATGRPDGQYLAVKDELTAGADGWFARSFRPGEKIAFLNLPEGSTYKVVEEDGRTSQYIVAYENAEGAIAYNEENTYPTAVVTNNKGKLIISKAVTGAGDKSKSFRFMVDLTDADGNKLAEASYEKGTTQGTLHVADEAIQLKDGESVTIYLPIGTQYKVTELEADKDGYTTTAQNNEGTVSREKPVQEAVFTNDKQELPPVPPTGSLTVSKTVAGAAGDQKKEWSFKVTLGSPLDGEYGAMTFTQGVANFKLAHGESIKAEGLPVGVTYQVEEAEADTDGYVTARIGATGEITEDEPARADFVNVKAAPEAKTGTLIVRKTVTGNGGETERAFRFTVTLGDRTVNGTYGDMKFTDGVAQFTLKNGEIRCSDLPAGITYTVTEAEANRDGYVTYTTGETGTISEKTYAEVAFRNHKEIKVPPEPSQPPVEPESAPPVAPTPQPEEPVVSVPRTADDSHPAVWMMLMALSALGLGLTLSRFRKNLKSKKK